MFLTIFVFTSISLFTTIALKYFFYPYIWLSFYWGIHFLYLVLKTRIHLLRIVLSNLAVLLFCLGSMEILAAAINVRHEKIEMFYNHQMLDEILGTAPEKGKSIRSREYYDNQLVYDVTYTIDKMGLRITPEFGIPFHEEAVLFFGCSFTFGEGLEDHETMPSLVGTLSKSKVYNFAFVGYGPHQMLSALEHGLVDSIVDCRPKYAIYQTSIFHVQRSVGNPSWTHHGPKYVLSPDGTPKYSGHFDDSPIIRRKNYFLEKSSIYKTFFENHYHLNKKDIDLYTSIVVESKRKLVKKYPGLEFHILYWTSWSGKEKTMDEVILERFRQEGIKIHMVKENILPGYFKSPFKYQISIHNVHPNFLTNKYLADYIVQNILKKSTA